MNNMEIISRESIAKMDFYGQEVLNSFDQVKERKEKLYRAMVLGNSYKRKVKIKFLNKNGMKKQVETTIWATTEKNIILKGGITIPISSIIDIMIY